MMQMYFQNNIDLPQLRALEIKPKIMQVKNIKMRDGFYKKKSVLCIV
jgi:hypothetical protein